MAGRDLYQRWYDTLRDRQAKLRILQRVNRMTEGHFGDHKPCRNGVWELRIDYGPGYRVYYAKTGTTILLLLAGGNKPRQAEDIDRATQLLADYQRRS
ncbi:MAG: type II toxin-antitoxin system RelE/ParE family toxin [Gammaproteobacteria bacterium]